MTFILLPVGLCFANLFEFYIIFFCSYGEYYYFFSFITFTFYGYSKWILKVTFYLFSFYLNLLINYYSFLGSEWVYIGIVTVCASFFLCFMSVKTGSSICFAVKFIAYLVTAPNKLEPKPMAPLIAPEARNVPT